MAAIASLHSTAHAQRGDLIPPGDAALCGTQTPETRLAIDYSQPLLPQPPSSIPVVFHVIYPADGTGNHTEATLRLQLDSLNTSFAPAGISFHLLAIDRVQSDDWFNLRINDGAARNALHVDPRRVMNVYVGDTSPYGGWASHPTTSIGSIDGMSIHYISLPGNHAWQRTEPFPSEGGTLVHEVGHWLNLYHTFQGGCHDASFPNCQQLYVGDEVCDTPPSQGGNCWLGTDCEMTIRPWCIDTCPQDAGLDPTCNYMSYAGDYCMSEFTPGQFDRMLRAASQYRPQLGQPVVYGRDLVVGPNRSLTWFGGTIQFEPGYRAQIQGAMSATGTTFTATNTTAGWGGIRYQAGSSGTINGGEVSRVGGYGGVSVDIVDASPTLTGTFIRQPATSGAVTGVRISGRAAFPVLHGNTIARHADGILLNSRARARLTKNVVQENTGTGLVAGYFTEAFLSSALHESRNRGNRIEFNGGRGVVSTSSAYLTFGYFHYPQYGYHADGFNSVTMNAGVGLDASLSGRIAAGNTQSQRKNRLFGNGLYDARAAGSGSRVFASCDWWDEPSPPFRTVATGGAILDDSWWLTQDPYDNPDAPCVTGTVDTFARGGDGPEPSSIEGTDGGDADTPRARLLAAVAQADEHPAPALAQLRRIVRETPDAPEAAIALAEAARIALRPGAPPGLAAWFEIHAAGADGRLRATARRALVGVHHGEGDAAGALAAAAALTAPDGAPDDVLFGHVARVYLHGEAGNVDAAAEALAAVEALAPGSAEATLARAFLDTDGAARLAGVSLPEHGMSAAEAPEGFRLEPVQPNPADGTAAVPFVLASPAHVRMVVYDVLGREVAVVTDGAFEAGRHRASVDAGQLAPGLYVVRALVAAEGAAPLILVGRFSVVAR